MKKTIYISGKISGLTKEEYTKNFDNAVNHFVWKTRFCREEIVNPLNIKPFLGIKYWVCYMINDIIEQRKCTHSAFQKNWTDSRGAVIEYFFAKFIFKQTIIFL